MDRKTHARYRARAEILKALAHPVRLYIVEALAEQERTMDELTELSGAGISPVTNHLALLKNAGLIEDEKRGPEVFYSLKCPCVLNFFQCVESVRLASEKKTTKPDHGGECRSRK